MQRPKAGGRRLASAPSRTDGGWLAASLRPTTASKHLSLLPSFLVNLRFHTRRRSRPSQPPNPTHHLYITRLPQCRRPPLLTKSTARGRLFVRRPLVTGPSQELLPRFIQTFNKTSPTASSTSTVLPQLHPRLSTIHPATLLKTKRLQD